METRITHLLFVLIGICPSISFAQTNKDSVIVSFQHIETKNYPNVQVAFKAESKTGIPLWNLKKHNIKIVENGTACPISHFQSKADNRPIAISLVIDHSESMEEDPFQLYDKDGKPQFTIDEEGNMIVSADYTSPLDNAKIAIKNFASTFNLSKDVISITGFSSKVDKTLPPTQNLPLIYETIDAFNPDGRTALYDGIINGLKQLSSEKGIKNIVVLTDGHDNESKATADDVIDLAVKAGVRVYAIGLGKVNIGELQKIADETRGSFYHTNSPVSLEIIYGEISQKMQQGFELEYQSATVQKDKQHSVNILVQTDEVVASATTNIFIPLSSPNSSQSKSKHKQTIVAKADLVSMPEPSHQRNIVKSNVQIPFLKIGKWSLAIIMALSILMVKRRFKIA